MARNSRGKERQRLKRKKKQLALRKAKNVTALQKVALGGGTLECLANPPDYREEGIVSIIVLAKTPGGRCAVAGFLVDLWCVGLKDAWGKSETPPEHLADLRDGARGKGAARMPVDEARRLVAAGVRFSRQNGFRLPEHWQKWVSVFGEMPPLESLDMSDFGVEGEGRGKKLRYVGTEQFLRSRLAGCTVEAFVARPDVEWIIGDDPADFDDFDEEADDEFDEADADEEVAAMTEMLRETSTKTADEVRKWCFAQSVVPHRLLQDAAQLLIIGLLPAMAYEDAVANGEVPPTAEPPDRWAPVEKALAEYPPDERQEMTMALDQVTRYMRSFTDPVSMLEAMGLTPAEEEEEETEDAEGAR
jgi:hypothetical protein